MQRISRAGTVVGAATLMLLTAGPGSAATPVSQATATALTISVAASPADSGTTSATNDGSGEVKTGEANPPVSVLGNQQLLNLGVLAQDATAKVSGRDGVSAACSGVAGDGASVANVGDSNCLTPGRPVGISIANLDLTGAVLIDPESALGGLAGLNVVMDQLVGPLTSTISDALEPLGETGLGGTLGAVQARCTARPGTASGTANIADTKLALSVGGQSIDLVELPASPPPNTHVVTDLDVVLNTVLDALRTDLNNTLDGALSGLSNVIDPVQDQIVDQLIAQVADQLAPLEENVLDIVLNKQVRPQRGAIEVTALDLQVLPAAAEFIDGSLVAAEIAKVTCGPSRRVGEPGEGPGPKPDVPTVVDAGVAGDQPAGGDDAALWAAALLLLGAAAGLMGYRRLSRR